MFFNNQSYLSSQIEISVYQASDFGVSVALDHRKYQVMRYLICFQSLAWIYMLLHAAVFISKSIFKEPRVNTSSSKNLQCLQTLDFLYDCLSILGIE